MLKLKCAGAVSGAVEVSESATVGDLVLALEELAGTAAGELKVIAGGKRLNVADRDALLKDLGLTATSRLVVSRSGAQSSYDAQAGRLARLDRISKAAEAIAARSGGSSRRAFSLETQEGDALQGGADLFFFAEPADGFSRLLAFASLRSRYVHIGDIRDSASKVCRSLTGRR
jgi:hypothetical protein